MQLSPTDTDSELTESEIGEKSRKNMRSWLITFNVTLGINRKHHLKFKSCNNIIYFQLNNETNSERVGLPIFILLLSIIELMRRKK